MATTTNIKSESKNTLPDSAFLKDFIKDDDRAEVVARGDVNGDGYEDAIVRYFYCAGASCTVDLSLVFNLNNKSTEILMNSSFEPAYRASSAIKSNVTNITIKDGIISLTGTALECPDSICDEAHRKIVRTVTYKYDGRSIVQIGVNPPLETMKIVKGTYLFNDVVNGTGATGILISPNEYKVTIKNDTGVGAIGININFPKVGSANIYANGVSSGDKVNIVFDSGDVNGSMDDSYKKYKKGDVLFTIKPASASSNDILIDWKKMTHVDYHGETTIFSKVNN